MAFWDQWLKDRIKGEIDDLVKSDEVAAPAPNTVANGNILPDRPEEHHDADGQIGRKGIIDDPYFDYTSQQILYKHKMSRLTHKTLKDVSLRDWIISTIIQCRVDTLVRFSRPEYKKFEMGFRVIKRDDKEAYTPTDQEEIAMLEDFIYHCGRKEGTPQDDVMLFGEFLKLIGRDALTFGHIAIEKVKTRRGGLHRFRPLPAESMYRINKKLSREYLEKELATQIKLMQQRMGDNDPRKEQQVNYADIDYYKYVQVSYDNRPLSIFGDEDLIFKLFNPQNFADSNGYCYIPGTAHVLLSDGSTKLVEHLQIGDEVVSHDGSINKVLEKKSRIVDEDTFVISPNGLMSQQVTSEHPILAITKKQRRAWQHSGETPKEEWISAKNLKKGDYVLVPKLKFDETFCTIDMAKYGEIDNEGYVIASLKQNCPQHQVTRFVDVDEDLGWLLGMYMGDGCSMQKGNTVRFDLGIHETYLVDRLVNILKKKFNIEVRVHEDADRGYVGVYAGSSVLHRMIQDLCPGNTYNKKLNPILYSTPKMFRWGMIGGHIDSDGVVYSSGDGTASSKSIDLAFAMQNLVNSLGYLAKIKKYWHKSGYATEENHSPSFRIQYPRAFVRAMLSSHKAKNVSGPSKKKHYYESDSFFYVSISDVSTKRYSGPVHNVEVENTHSYMANQIATHNCYSPLELSIINVTNHMNVESYNANFFTHGYAARGILHLKGTVTQANLANFRRQFYNTISGQQHAWRTPIVAGLDEVQWVPMSANAREMEYINFNNHLLRIICSQFQIDPVELGLDYLISANGRAPMQQANNEYKIAYSRERGLYPILHSIEDMINSDIIPALDRGLAAKYKFIFTGFTDETAQTEIAQMQAEMTVWKTMNDLMIQAQKDKIKHPIADLPLNQAFWALVEKNLTRGEIRENFLGDKGASQRKELQYIPGDQAFLAWQQALLAIEGTKDQKAQADMQMKAQADEAQKRQEEADLKHKHAEAKNDREDEKHKAEMEQVKSDAAANAVRQGNLRDNAKTFGATGANNIGGKVMANPINKLPES